MPRLTTGRVDTGMSLFQNAVSSSSDLNVATLKLLKSSPPGAAHAPAAASGGPCSYAPLSTTCTHRKKVDAQMCVLSTYVHAHCPAVDILHTPEKSGRLCASVRVDISYNPKLGCQPPCVHQHTVDAYAACVCSSATGAHPSTPYSRNDVRIHLSSRTHSLELPHLAWSLHL